jgi:5-methylcytosine-specific restriction endonuclease McrA
MKSSTYKVCTACKSKASRRPSKDGQYRCKKCNSRLRNARYYASARGQDTMKAYREANSEKITARATKWNRENKERHNATHRKYSQSEKGRAGARIRSRKRYWSDPEYNRMKAVARAHGTVPTLIAEVLKNPCQICGTTENLTVDHMHPISEGGKTTVSNLQSLCNSCNSFKQARLVLAGNMGVIIDA